jgi:hypothetical protein
LAPPKKREGPIPELTSLNLLKTGTALPSAQGHISVESNSTSWATDGPFRKTWRRFQPAGEPFSALLPNGGEQGSKTIPFGDQKIDVHYYRTRDGNSMFELAWMSGPYLGETDSSAIQSGLRAIIRGVSFGYEESSGKAFQCEPTSETSVSTAGYKGKQFDLSECIVPGMARVYTKTIGDQRHLYLGFVFYKEDDENVRKFLESFTMNAPKKAGIKKNTEN